MIEDLSIDEKLRTLVFHLELITEGDQQAVAFKNRPFNLTIRRYKD